ncbi:MAG TPA: hypothetical protein VMG37_10565, partial [Solirubrobacteraceae bacterium]|nr:hypothetical protein [Solirubrobacteraceae bacterium]
AGTTQDELREGHVRNLDVRVRAADHAMRLLARGLARVYFRRCQRRTAPSDSGLSGARYDPSAQLCEVPDGATTALNW